MTSTTLLSTNRRRATENRAGVAEVMYQAHVTDGTWRGSADFL